LCETWFLLYEEAAFEDRVLRRISAPRRKDVTEGGANGIIRSFIIHSVLFNKHYVGALARHVTHAREKRAACA
jgi:hypothetical protein